MTDNSTIALVIDDLKQRPHKWGRGHVWYFFTNNETKHPRPYDGGQTLFVRHLRGKWFFDRTIHVLIIRDGEDVDVWTKTGDHIFPAWVLIGTIDGNDEQSSFVSEIMVALDERAVEDIASSRDAVRKQAAETLHEALVSQAK